MAGDISEEFELTPEMVEAGLEWLYAYTPGWTNGPATAEALIRAALATQPRHHQQPCCPPRKYEPN